MCADAPNTDGINAAAKANSDIAKEALAWYKQQYADTAPDRARATQLALDQATVQNQLSHDQLDLSRQERERYNTTYKPIEERIASDAIAYDTPARREAEAAAARADVEREVALQRAATGRALERQGVNPGSGRNLALQSSIDLGAAKLKAGAANTARKQVETVGAAKMADAAAMGRGVFTNQGTSASLAVNAGNSSVNNGQVPITVGNQGAALMGQGFQTGIQGNQSSGSLYGQAAQLSQKDNSGMWGALGQVAGGFAGSQAGSAALVALSDKKAKKDVKPVKGEVALAAARRMPVKDWKYRAGRGDGGRHVGPMAQDVHAAAGEQVAPGGKQIDLVSMNGITLGAVQELDRRVSRLEKRRAAA